MPPNAVGKAARVAVKPSVWFCCLDGMGSVGGTLLSATNTAKRLDANGGNVKPPDLQQMQIMCQNRRRVVPVGQNRLVTLVQQLWTQSIRRTWNLVQWRT